MLIFTNLKVILKRIKSAPNTFGTNEIGATTVQKPGKIVAKKGEKQVSQTTFAEWDVQVTLCCAINAMAYSILPFIVFPESEHETLLFER